MKKKSNHSGFFLLARYGPVLSDSVEKTVIRTLSQDAARFLLKKTPIKPFFWKPHQIAMHFLGGAKPRKSSVNFDIFEISD